MVGARLVPGAFGDNVAGTAELAIAGLLVGVGTTLGNGCTSGHGISGGLQLAVSSWVFFGAMFASGVGTALLLFGRGGRGEVSNA